jgi:hypothetical protein
MEKNRAFEILEEFKKIAKLPTHLYDAYHGEVEPVVLWFLYEDEGNDAKTVASVRFENVFFNEEYIVEVVIRGKLYQMFDYESCLSLIKSIKY